MQYHSPDPTWQAVSCNDFETYLGRYVIKGCFHKAVPKDVVDSYSVAEYIMALSYYHYPMYDDAFSKLLRTIELAVKLRCSELVIPPVEKKSLKSLVGLIQEKEPRKNLGPILDIFREVRNLYMHPNKFSFGGLALKIPIMRVNNVLNQLFFSEDFFLIRENKLREIQDMISVYSNGFFCLQIQDQCFIINEFHIIDAIPLDKDWVYCCTFKPPMKIVEDDSGATASQPSLNMALLCIKMNSNEVSAIEEGTVNQIKVFPIERNAIGDMNDIMDNSSDFPEHVLEMHTYLNSYELREFHTTFLYQYLSLAKS